MVEHDGRPRTGVGEERSAAGSEDLAGAAGVEFVNAGEDEAPAAEDGGGGSEADSSEVEEARPEAGPADVGKLKEELRREFQSQKDREIHRERLKWEEELRAKAELRGLEQLSDGEIAEKVRKEAMQRAESRMAHLGALEKLYGEMATTLRQLPSLASLPEAEWAAIRNSDSFEHFLESAVTAAVQNQFGDEIETKAKALAEAKFRDRMRQVRVGEPAPDLTPPTGGGGSFAEIESKYLAGELAVEAYEAARRREGLEVY